VKTAILKTALIGAVMLSGAEMPAYAGPLPTTFAFDYNQLSKSNANDMAIQKFMDGILGSAGSVTVTGAVASKTWNGDGHVVGPGNSGTSYTLANEDGTFIMNNQGGGFNSITMAFKGITIDSLSFDYEIFPDITCQNLKNCGGKGNLNLPDITVDANGKQVFQDFGVQPGQAGGSPYLHSPNSGNHSDELAPQLLGSTSLTFAPGVTTLVFNDWPPEIGIDNLVIVDASTPVPEPATLALFGTALAGLGWMQRRRKTR